MAKLSKYSTIQQVEAALDKTANISVTSTTDDTEEQIWQKDDGSENYASVGSYGIKSKAYLNNDGTKAIPDIDTTMPASPTDTKVPSTKMVKEYVANNSGNNSVVGDRTFSGDDVIFNDNDDNYVGHVDADGIHAKKFYLQNSKDGTKTDINDIVGSQNIQVSLPDKIYAVVGDTLQLFYRGMICAVEPYRFDILVSCSKGKQTPRYFEYTPSSTDVGTTTFKLQVKDDNGRILGEKSCSLVTCSAPSNPSSKKNVLCFGDSLTTDGYWCAEAYRRLHNEGGNPSGNNLSNISFCGSKTKDGAGYFGVGGWRWNSYTTSGNPAFRFQVSGVNTLSYGDVYTNNGHDYTIIENNTTSGSGNILCSVSSSSYTPTDSGTLTKKSGNGDDTISFASYSTDSQNPLWDYTNNKMTFVNYANSYCNGQIDVVYTLLTWNGQSPHKTDFSAETTEIKKFADTLHTEFPNAKLKIMGIQVPSVNGGMGANYGASGSGYADTYGMVVTALNQNKAYQDFANQNAYKTFVEFINVSSQFDTEYNCKSSTKSVNTRNSTTEVVDTNGVHPSVNGYYQIADVVYRNIVYNYCQ